MVELCLNCDYSVLALIIIRPTSLFVSSRLSDVDYIGISLTMSRGMLKKFRARECAL